MIKGLLDMGKGLLFSDPAKDIGDISDEIPSPVVDEGSKEFDGVLPDFREGVTDHPSGFRILQLSQQFDEGLDRALLKKYEVLVYIPQLDPRFFFENLTDPFDPHLITATLNQLMNGFGLPVLEFIGLDNDIETF